MNYLVLLFYLASQYVISTSSMNIKIPKSSTKRPPELEDIEIEKQFPARWLELPVDHFNLFDERTWKMKYLVYEEFFEEGSPLFIEVGGEWSIHGKWFLSGQLHKLAKKHKGMLIETEHRYYGKSLPLSTNFTTEDLKYLQIEQALEDLAYFIEHFKSITPGAKNSKVIIHGCSYPGMLVTWMRLRFPHIVDIAYASSAPLGVGLDYPEFFEVVNDVYANVSSHCINAIREGFNQTEMLLKTKRGRKLVRSALSKWNCGNVDEMNTFQILSTYRKVLNVMHDPFHYEDVSCVVLTMDAYEKDAFERLANFVVLKSEDRGICTKEIELEMNEEVALIYEAQIGEPPRNGKAWQYQTCTEMGTFTTLNRTNSRHPFAMDMSLQDSIDRCVRAFGGMVTEDVLLKGIESVTRRYGGKKPKVTKVVTVQGAHDPWKHLANLEDYNSEAPVIMVDGSHCTDVLERDDDPDELLELRERIRNLISDWIREIS